MNKSTPEATTHLVSVLIIEDDTLAREHLESLVDAAGYNIVSTASIEEALAALRVVTFAIVILDRMLEGRDGIELCESIRKAKSKPQPYIVVLTARDLPKDAAEGYAAGADAYMSKNSSEAEIIQQLRAAEAVLLKRS